MRESIRHKALAVWKKLRALLTVRSVALLLVVFIVVTGGQRIAGSWLIPSGSISRQVVQAISKWTGYEVVSSGRSALSFWPSPKVTIEGVMLLPPGGHQSEPLMSIHRVTAGFSVMSVLLGDPVFKTIELEEPDITVAIQADGAPNWKPAGRLGELLSKPDEQADIAAAHVGRILVNAGKLHFKRDGREQAFIDEMHGTIDLRSASGPLSVDMDGKFNGQTVNVTATAASTSDLLFGKPTSFSTDLSATSGSVKASGKMSISSALYLDGRVKLVSSDTGKFASWLGLSYPALRSIGALDVDATLSSEGAKLTLSDLKLQAGNASANGALMTGWTGLAQTPFLSGTLAFDNFDCQAFMAAFINLPGSKNSAAFDIDTAFLGQLQMDLRFSASKATFSAVTMTDFAAGARIVDGHASFSLATGQFAGGTFSGELMLDDNAQAGRAASLHLEGANINLAEVPEDMRPLRFWPEATGSLELDAKAALPTTSVSKTQMIGSLKIDTGAGTLEGFDPKTFRELAGDKRFFDLSEAATGSMAFDKLDLDASLVNGVAELRHASVEGSSGRLAVNGVVPFHNSSIAMTGTLTAPPADALPDVRFFAGGAWPTVVISPASTVLNGQ